MASATHFAVNPKTGERLMLLGGQWVPATQAATGSVAGAPRLTEDQGKSQGYAKLMADAERSYDAAVTKGYNPADARNSWASFAEGFPLGWGDGIGSIIRNDVSDRGRQAELQWTDAQLKAMSGAASPEAEVKRNVKTYFPRPGEDQSAISGQKLRSRQVAYGAAKTRAGPAGTDLPAYPGTPPAGVPEAGRQGYVRLFQAGKIDLDQPRGSQANPFLAKDASILDKLPAGAYVVTPEGHLGVIE
jgi:hypothetical protein